MERQIFFFSKMERRICSNTTGVLAEFKGTRVSADRNVIGDKGESLKTAPCSFLQQSNQRAARLPPAVSLNLKFKTFACIRF